MNNYQRHHDVERSAVDNGQNATEAVTDKMDEGSVDDVPPAREQAGPAFQEQQREQGHYHPATEPRVAGMGWFFRCSRRTVLGYRGDLGKMRQNGTRPDDEIAEARMTAVRRNPKRPETGAWREPPRLSIHAIPTHSARCR